MRMPSDVHRDSPRPRRPWIMRQTWHDLLFVHHRVGATVLRPLVPACLELQTFDGCAWVGVVPFRMSGVRLRGLPPLPGVAAFPELNVRTYVAHEGRPGVYFFCLEARSRLAVEAARAWFGLPYHHAAMTCTARGDDVVYSSLRTDRRGAPARFEGAYGPRGDVSHARAGSLDHWLTERYCLYSVSKRGRLLHGDIHHEPWPLQPATAEIAVDTLPSAHGIEIDSSAPLLHFARRLDVWLWAPRPVSASGSVSAPL